MLPLVLIFLFAQGAFSLPVLDVNFYDIIDSPVIPDNGQLINRNITTGAMEYIDGGDIPMYGHMIIAPVHDMASLNDPSSQALAALHIITIMGEMANGIPGDACAASAFINAYLNNGGKSAVASYVQQIIRYIDVIDNQYQNLNAVRYSAGSRGNCAGGGRTYPFEEVWDTILNNCNSWESALLNEEYCAAKRLYSAWNVRSNNIAAAFTASSIPEIREIVKQALPQVADLLRTVANGGNPHQAAQDAKAALLGCVY
ncbi:fibroin light chain-like [Pararge aegeria]|uniref:Jg17873 protein n=1 Tax=Pararge aegeria aegeria TaxID=348720 RepID=A0A8S4SKC6_9NEOP|nr:fibroin light chain-like [Pararge aegeria]CAH2270020.1 jg17873 [Pararge aegeria aegeria]